MSTLHDSQTDGAIPKWTNQNPILYHGTTSAYAVAIVAEGVNLEFTRPLTDFGPGFYTTTNLTQARRFA